MLKPANILIGLGIVAALASPANAFNLDDAFKSLSGGAVGNYNQPGHYANSARHNFVAGGAELRMPQTRTTLMSVTPPSLNAGCSGISAHFGGFSFVSGKKIEELVSNIAANSTGLVINLVLKTLCPICQGVIEAMTHLAQQASKMSIDSCSAAESLMSNGFGIDPNSVESGNAQTSVCGKMLSHDGKYQSYMDAMENTCKEADTAVQELEGVMAKRKPPTKDANGNEVIDATGQDLPIGNRTWEILKAAGYAGSDPKSVRLRTLMLNMLGTVVSGGTDTSGAKRTKDATYPAMLDPDKLMDLFLCGTGQAYAADVQSGESPAAAQLCAADAGYLANASVVQTNPGGDIQVLSCARDLTDCKNNAPEYVSASSEPSFGGSGFLFQVSGLMHQAVEDIRANRPLTDPALLTLLENVPYPVYQVLNVAAVYPIAAHDLIDSMSVTIADSMATALFSDVVRAAGRVGAETYIDLNSIHRLQEASEKFMTTVQRRQTLLAQRVAMQEAMIADIRTINVAIQRDVLGEELLGSSRFAGEVNDSVANTNN